VVRHAVRARALAEGLVAVHEAGVVHRDLKPSNILLSPKGPRIIDFGIAWATGASTLTHVGTAVGSPGFLAPEQVRGAAVTPATDVFAFGATLAYAATADSPFGQGSSEVMLYRVVHEEPDLTGVPDALAPLVYACLAKDPEERPSTVQLSERLAEIAAREARGIGAPRREGLPKAAGPRPERPTGRRAEEYAQQHTERRPAGGPTNGRTGGAATGGTGGPGSGAAGGVPGGRNGRGPAAGRTNGGGGAGTNGGSGGRPGSRTPPPRPPAPRSGAPRTPTRTPAGRRSAVGTKQRLMRQRLVVFVIVTVLAAIVIAAAQGCHRLSRGLGGSDRAAVTVSAPAPEGLFAS
jgi:hypothetical protein